MSEHPLKTLDAYSSCGAKVFDRAEVIRSTVSVWPDSPFTGTAEGEVNFKNGIRLRLREEIDFETGVLSSYGYEVYRGDQRLYWYDDFPHPNDATLASTFPHHKHVPPEIKRNRVSAPGIAFDHPNLELLVAEILDFE